MNRTLKTVLIAATILLIMGGCIKWKYEEMTIVRQPYNGNQLRLDGYYYYSQEEKVWNTYFFYRNGTLHYGIGNSPDMSIDMYDSWFASDDYKESIKTDRRRWGLFEIQDDSIVFERWGIQEFEDPVIRYSGHIINDTTFIISRVEYPHTGGVYEKNELYRFHAFSPKPDSTNTFIP